MASSISTHPSQKKLNYVIKVFHCAYLGVAEEKDYYVKTRNKVVSDLGSNHYSNLDGTDNRSSLKLVTRGEKKYPEVLGVHSAKGQCRLGKRLSEVSGRKQFWSAGEGHSGRTLCLWT